MKDEIKTKRFSFIPHPSSLIPCLVLSLLGILVLLYVTAWGVGVSPDSTVYIGAARHLLHGEGLSVLGGRSGQLEPLTHYPPLYPALLALASVGRSDPLAAARWVNALVFGANILLAGLSARLSARRSAAGAGLVASLLVACAPDLLEIHSMAWTEPLFILFCMAALLLLAAYLERGRRALLLLAGLMAALAFLTRYVGVVLVGTGACALLCFDERGERERRRRFADALLFGFTGCLPMLLWMLRNSLLSGDATDRRFVFHPVSLSQLASALSTVSTWLLLGKVRTGVRAAVFLFEIACLLALSVFLWRKQGGMKMRGLLSGLPALVALFIIFYLCFLVFTASFIDFDTVFDERALAPVHALGIVLAVSLAHRLFGTEARGRALNWTRLLPGLLAVVFVASYALRGTSWVWERRGDGQGYTSRAWARSATIERIRALPPETLIFSNGYDAVYFLTGRRAAFIPEKIVHGTGRPNRLYEAQLAHVREQLLEHDGVLVYFDRFPERAYLPSEDELRERLELYLVSREQDGSIYRAEHFEAF
jgi:4-amino-4-deoxy-L-arabinose transferase-like glycosyltransferase